MTNHSAVPSYVGFAFQPLHALLTLLRTQDDDAFVRIEAEDDVVLGVKGEVQQLQQLKHISKSLGYKSNDFWRTLKVWLDYVEQHKEGSPHFILISTSSIVSGDPITLLNKNFKSLEEIKQLDACLKAEAERVCAERERVEQEALSQNKNPKGTYDKRINACQAYCAAVEDDRLFLLSRASIIPASTPIQEINLEIEKQLMNYPREIRVNLGTRTAEWWSNISLRSVLGKRDQSIYKDELTRYLTQTASELLQNILIDDMAHMNPPQSPPVHPVAQKQLELIDAKDHIIYRSSRTHWLAREQRSKWIKDNPSNLGRINDFDQDLENEWISLFAEVCSTCLPDEPSQKVAGTQVLNWSHTEAHSQVRSIREGWSNPDLVRGSYQVLASALRVGWHPKFKEKLGEASDDSSK